MIPAWAVPYQGWVPVDSEAVIQHKMIWVNDFTVVKNRNLALDSNPVHKAVGQTLRGFLQYHGLKCEHYSKWIYRKGPKSGTISSVASMPLPLP